MHYITLPELRTGEVEWSYKIQIYLLQKQLRTFKKLYNEIHNTQSTINRIQVFTATFNKHYTSTMVPQVTSMKSPTFYVFKKALHQLHFPSYVCVRAHI